MARCSSLSDIADAVAWKGVNQYLCLPALLGHLPVAAIQIQFLKNH